MAKHLIILTLLYSTLVSGQITVTGACACNSTIGDTFTEIDDFIVDDNLSEIESALDEPIEKKEEKIEKLKQEIKTLETIINQNKNDITYLAKIAFLLEQEIQIRKFHKTVNPVDLLFKPNSIIQGENNGKD